MARLERRRLMRCALAMAAAAVVIAIGVRAPLVSVLLIGLLLLCPLLSWVPIRHEQRSDLDGSDLTRSEGRHV